MDLLAPFLPSLGGLGIEASSEVGVVVVQLIMLAVATYLLIMMIIPMLRGVVEKAIPNLGELFVSIVEWTVWLAVADGAVRLVINGFFAENQSIASYLQTIFIITGLGWYALSMLISFAGLMLILAIARKLANK